MRTHLSPGLWMALAIAPAVFADPPKQPNVLWISCEDISADLGCYGDRYAVTPHIDRLAAEGVRFTRCFTHAGVCAPSRSGLITGMYPNSIGTHHMRCKGVPPAEVRCFPEYLRAAGYYCTNNVKTDYQFDAPASAWDENSNKADWRGRKAGQPFFCVINFTTTHESQIRAPSNQTQQLVSRLSAAECHDPAKAVVPPYYPDTPAVRRDLANYYDNITAMDRQVGEVLAKLTADGLADDTIVWFWGDHGRGLPRCKRWLYDSGTHVPLIIRVPEKWRSHVAADPSLVAPGKTWDDLVGFIDFAPTLLSLAGVAVPDHLQGQAFLGPQAKPPRQYVYGHRDRMDETYDLIRTVRDRRFRYFRNFMPDVSYSQDIAYMNEMPTMQELRRLHAEGKLTGPPALFFRSTKPAEELFDTEADPHELHNLADDPQYRDVLLKLRAECQRWMASIGDVGLIPEAEFDELKRPGGKYAVAAPPVVSMILTDGVFVTTLFMPHDPATSIVYLTGEAAERADDKSRWELYHRGITATTGVPIAVRACRIGFRDSPIITWKAGGTPPEQRPSAVPPHWRDTLAQSQVLERLTALSAPETWLNPNAAVWRSELRSEHAPVRYWALRTLARGDAAAVSADELRRLRDTDPSPLVQITAAKLLAERGDVEASLKVLTGYLKQSPQDSVRLAAAIALRDLGETARPALPDLEATAMQGEYVARVSQAALARLQPSR